jgi:hypothetical protein
MAGDEEHFDLCAECGATIYPEHLAKGTAEHVEGKLLCPFCVREKRSGSTAGLPAIGNVPGGDEPVAVVEVEPGGPRAVLDQPLAYDKKPTAVRTGGGGGPAKLSVGQVVEQAFHRPLLRGSPTPRAARRFTASSPTARSHTCASRSTSGSTPMMPSRSSSPPARSASSRASTSIRT